MTRVFHPRTEWPVELIPARINAITSFTKRFVDEARAEEEKNPDVVMRLETLASGVFTTLLKNLQYCDFSVKVDERKPAQEAVVTAKNAEVLEALQRCSSVCALSVDVCSILDYMDYTNPDDDGGGELELSPLVN